ncbi:glutamate-5-semialdehyde dehydrogenase [Magnetospirillum moscoviense]|uniref:Gamma-glutamyl phosphate reductase n=1 Tax=Magnetospirillum moscoviense TaxID=1437059 RepID=A0A178MZV7_9PROT|nr:glutamate-5-semialdehyde dehydrogenase [Magnetospirillum moscoviense]OAN65810.1 gamma-glutamyl-phosphate reductase [Magnetospirillum moscoviense]
MTEIHSLMTELGRAARAAGRVLALTPDQARNDALKAAAARLRASASAIKAANGRDMEAGRAKGLSDAMLDRLMLDDKRIQAMARGLEDIAQLPDPVGRVLADWTRPNGLRIQRVAVPLGVIGIIYESRPNVTADAAGLCLKSGNAAILRGGSESFHSSHAIMAALAQGITDAGLPANSVQMVPTTDRAAVGEMLTMTDFIDVIVPRGGKSLVARVREESKVPLFQHLEGICHTYVDGAADIEMARSVVLNAKMRRTGICGSTETLLVDRRLASTGLALLVSDLLAAGCEVRGCALTQEVDDRVVAATEEDWRTEYLDKIISVRVVDGVQAAIDHVNTYGSQHTEAIVTEDPAAAETFLNGCDSAIVCWNASTQFADGGEFGMGAEIGISTGRMHARGPVGIEQLCTFKYKVLGSGQVRPS